MKTHELRLGMFRSAAEDLGNLGRCLVGRHQFCQQISSWATLEEINSRRGGRLYLRLVGFPSAPLMLTVYCAKESAKFRPPVIGNTMALHYKSKMKGKNYNFHFVNWQDSAMQKGEGDFALQFGGEDDTFYGL